MQRRLAYVEGIVGAHHFAHRVGFFIGSTSLTQKDIPYDNVSHLILFKHCFENWMHIAWSYIHVYSYIHQQIMLIKKDDCIQNLPK